MVTEVLFSVALSILNVLIMYSVYCKAVPVNRLNVYKVSIHLVIY